MAWRRGQRVECISENLGNAFALYPELREMSTPKLGQRYTIDSILPSGEFCRACGHEHLFFTFYGLRPDVAYIDSNFRALVENDQANDISALVDAAAKVTLPKREDAKPAGSVSATIAHGGAVLRTLREQRAVLMGDRPGEALLTPRQLAALQGFTPHFADQVEAEIEACAILDAAVDQAADEIAREFVRTFIMPWLPWLPWLVKRLGL